MNYCQWNTVSGQPMVWTAFDDVRCCGQTARFLLPGYATIHLCAEHYDLYVAQFGDEEVDEWSE